MCFFWTWIWLKSRPNTQNRSNPVILVKEVGEVGSGEVGSGEVGRWGGGEGRSEVGRWRWGGQRWRWGRGERWEVGRWGGGEIGSAEGGEEEGEGGEGWGASGSDAMTGWPTWGEFWIIPLTFHWWWYEPSSPVVPLHAGTAQVLREEWHSHSCPHTHTVCSSLRGAVGKQSLCDNPLHWWQHPNIKGLQKYHLSRTEAYIAMLREATEANVRLLKLTSGYSS